MEHDRVKDICYIGLFAAVICICSWISVPFVVPFTLQTFGVFLTLMVLGGKRGTFSIILYVLLGALGLPVFASFNGGLAYIFGPTGGFIVGFIFAGIIYCIFEKIFEIKTLLVSQEKISFNALVSSDFSRSEIINLFLALLELLKRQYITVSQEENYGEIKIFRNDLGEKLDE